MLQTIQWNKLPATQKVSDLILADGGTSMTLAELHSKMNTNRNGTNRFEWANARNAIQYLKNEVGNKFDIKELSVGHVLKVCENLVKTNRSPETAKKVKQGVAWLVRFANDVDKEKHVGALTVAPFKNNNNELKTFKLVKIDKADVDHLWSQKKPTIYADFTNMVIKQLKRIKDGEPFGFQGMNDENPTKAKARLQALQKAIRPHGWWARWNPVENLYMLRKGMEPKKRGVRT